MPQNTKKKKVPKKLKKLAKTQKKLEPVKHNQRDLNKMKREELEVLAVELGINKPHLVKNKTTLVFDMLRIQGRDVDNPDILSDKERVFCDLFVTDFEFSGNGVQSYIEAFNVSMGAPGAYEAAKADSSRLLSKPAILTYCNELLEQHALNDVNVDKQLAFLINQQADFKTKMTAIREYNLMKERVKQNAPTVNFNFFSFADERAQKLVKSHRDWVMEQTKAGIIDIPEQTAANS